MMNKRFKVFKWVIFSVLGALAGIVIHYFLKAGFMLLIKKPLIDINHVVNWEINGFTIFMGGMFFYLFPSLILTYIISKAEKNFAAQSSRIVMYLFLIFGLVEILYAFSGFMWSAVDINFLIKVSLKNLYLTAGVFFIYIELKNKPKNDLRAERRKYSDETNLIRQAINYHHVIRRSSEDFDEYCHPYALIILKNEQNIMIYTETNSTKKNELPLIKMGYHNVDGVKISKSHQTENYFNPKCNKIIERLIKDYEHFHSEQLIETVRIKKEIQ